MVCYGDDFALFVWLTPRTTPEAETRAERDGAQITTSTGDNVAMKPKINVARILEGLRTRSETLELLVPYARHASGYRV